jgi:hypothetical protein
MGTTLLDVCNRALSRVGAIRITALTDTSALAKAVSACFPSAPDWVLRTWHWKFAIKRAELRNPEAATGTAWTWRYTLPSDYFEILPHGTHMDDVEFVEEGGSLLCDVEAPLELRYVSQVTDAALWDAAFTEVLAWKIAMEIQPEFSTAVSLLSLKVSFAGALREAQRSGAIERGVDEEQTDRWLAARM